ncbi:MAG: GAF domain-containing protein [Actinomycetes bacterium]
MVGSPTGEFALPAGANARQAARAMSAAHELFVTGDRSTAASRVRPLILDSWRRAATLGVDPSTPEMPVVLDDSELDDARSRSPLAAIIPLIRSILTGSASEAGHVVAVGDETGRLLWVEGDSRAVRRAESIGFTQGSLWAEEVAGTNAPGTSLAIDSPVQIFRAEHFVGSVHSWSCVAVPVHDPSTGETIGVIDVTGGDSVASPLSLGLVRATVAAAERELRALAVVPRQRRAAPVNRPWRLQVLGRDRAVLVRGGDSVQLSARHSELMLLLAMNRSGLSAATLAVLLSDEEIPTVTIRAEMTRLRRIVGPQVLMSNPYRLCVDLSTDVDEVGGGLDQGSWRKALHGYAGPVLPSSDSPAIAELRWTLESRVRRAALGTRDPEAILAYAATPLGRDDVEVLKAAFRALPARSPRRSSIAVRIASANRQHG